MRPYNNTRIDWRVFKSDKYYILVYQTMIEKGWHDLRTLSSRSIAQHLWVQWNTHYWPRTSDIKMLKSIGPNNDRNIDPRHPEAVHRQEQLHSHSDLSFTGRNAARFRRRKRKMQLGAERINWSMAKRRQNIYRSSQPQNTRRSWRKDTRRDKKDI